MTAQCRLGNGTTPTKRDSGNITFTRTGTTVTASDSFFLPADINRVLKFDSGPEMYIRAVISETVAEVDASGNDSATEGTIWHVEQSRLTNQLKNVSANSSLENGSEYNAQTGAVRHRRTFLFAIESASVLYTEIGWSYSGGASTDLFGRDLIPGGGDALVANQQYRVRVDLYVVPGPVTPQPVDVLVEGWPAATGMGMLESAYQSVIASSGASLTSFRGLDPIGDSLGVFVSQSTAALAAPASVTAGRALAGSAIYKGVTARAYANGAFERIYDASLAGVAAGLSLDAIRSVGLCSNASSTAIGTAATTINSIYRVLMDTAQAKHAYYQLDLTFRYSWGRVLVN